MITAMQQIAQTLARPTMPRTASGARTHAGVMLDAMRSRGTLTSAELAEEVGLSSSLVGPLLKHHVQNGRVVMDWNSRGRRTWRISDGEADLDAQRTAVRAAVVLLRRHGFTVHSPPPP